MRLFATIRIGDPQIRQWFVDVIRAQAYSGQADNKQHRLKFQRHHEQVETKLKALLDLRIAAEITPSEYATKRAEFHNRQAALRLQLESTDRDDHEVAEVAVKAFELSQSLMERWVKEITLQNARF